MCDGAMPCPIHQSLMTFSRAVRWIQSWATLVTAVSAYTASKSHLILDFIDYPDKAGLKWEANNGLPGSGLPPWYPTACTMWCNLMLQCCASKCGLH